MYFWFPKTDEGRRLAARAEEGMRMMIADGTYDRIFDRYQRSKIERLRLKEREVTPWFRGNRDAAWNLLPGACRPEYRHLNEDDYRREFKLRAADS